MAQDIHGAYVGDDDDLPNEAVAQQRDPATGQFLPSPQANQVRSAAAPEPEAPQLSAFSLAKAREYGVDVTGLGQGELDRILLAVSAHRKNTAVAARPAEAPKPAERPAVDWGENEDGTPLTEEQAKKLFPRPIFNLIKNGSRIDDVVEGQKKIAESIEQERQERAKRQALRQINEVLATRPDLFGDKPGEADEGTPEFERYQLAMAFIGRQFQAGKQTTPKGDAARAIAVLGPAQAPAARAPAQPAARQPLDYGRAELARPTGRKGGDVVSRRTAMIQAEAERLKENGSLVPAGFGGDDDDLPE